MKEAFCILKRSYQIHSLFPARLNPSFSLKVLFSGPLVIPHADLWTLSLWSTAYLKRYSLNWTSVLFWNKHSFPILCLCRWLFLPAYVIACPYFYWIPDVFSSYFFKLLRFCLLVLILTFNLFTAHLYLVLSDDLISMVCVRRLLNS